MLTVSSVWAGHLLLLISELPSQLQGTHDVSQAQLTLRLKTKSKKKKKDGEINEWVDG